MNIFDLSIAYHDDKCESELLIFHLLTCFYFVHKVEKDVSGCGISFEIFEDRCRRLPSYKQLKQNVITKIEVLRWEDAEKFDHIYPKLESDLLASVLRFKIDWVSYAEAVYNIVCTATDCLMLEQGTLFTLLNEALYRTYICLLGKFSHSPWRRHPLWPFWLLALNQKISLLLTHRSLSAVGYSIICFFLAHSNCLLTSISSL